MAPKNLIITEKPSVAQQFAKVLHVEGRKQGFFESSDWCVTWAVGHLVTLSYPDKYDEKYKKWVLKDLPFLPDEYKYEILPKTKDQFKVIDKLLHRDDIQTIYNAGDSGREGEYIQRLILDMTKNKKPVKRVWIDSQTDDEILRGIREAKDSSYYDKLSDSAYMRAIEDYSIGINLSRLFSIVYGYEFNKKIKSKKNIPIAVGRVMSCVLGMIVEREREIRDFKSKPYYKLQALIDSKCSAQWKAVEGTKYFNSPLLHDETGFKEESDAAGLKKDLDTDKRLLLKKLEKKVEKKNAPLLFNLAELQSTCTKILKLSPADTLSSAQRLYEAKMTTYPRTDARVLSSAVAKEIDKNLKGLAAGKYKANIAAEILKEGRHKGIEKSRYTDDKKITDHYAIIPTGQQGSYDGISETDKKVYHIIVNRFLAIFLPAAVYDRYNATFLHENGEYFFATEKVLKQEGFLALYKEYKDADTEDKEESDEKDHLTLSEFTEGKHYPAEFSITTAHTSPPKRYTSGSLILAMENAGKLIEDEELREQIKGTGIGTAATRAGIIEKLVKNSYIRIQKKTQVVTPDPIGEAVYDIILPTIPSLLNPKMTASWEKGLSQIESGEISKDVFKDKLYEHIRKWTEQISKNASEKVSSYDGTSAEKVLIGKCPLCGKDVFTTRTGGWACSNYVKDNPKKSCIFGLPAAVVDAMTEENKKSYLETATTGRVRNVKSNKSNAVYDVEITAKKGADKLEYDFFDTENESEHLCPNCKKKLTEKKYSFECSCGFNMSSYIAKTKIPEEYIKDLLTKGQCKSMKITKKSGDTFTAGLKLDPKTGNLSFMFDN